jgi:Zn-dependent metalloprotease
LKGEDVATSNDKRPLNSLKQPGTAYDDPVIGKDVQISHVRYLKENTDPGSGTYMYSGIPNNAFYETAIRIGSQSAGVIWTEALKDPGLAQEMTFKRLAQITYDVAVRLHGNNSAESRAVIDAWNVVGVVVGQ